MLDEVIDKEKRDFLFKSINFAKNTVKLSATGWLFSKLLGCGSSRIYTEDEKQIMETCKKRAKIKTIGHEFLDLESKYGTSLSDEPLSELVSEARENLDEIIEIAKEKLAWMTAKEKYNIKDAFGFLETMYDILDECGFKYKEKIVFSDGLVEKEIDCDLTSIIYLSVGEALGLPKGTLGLMNVEKHAFVRFTTHDKIKIDWETMGRALSLNYPYYNIFSMDLKSLTKEELKAEFYGSIGLAWAKKKNHDKSIKFLTEAIKLNPKNFLVFHNRGEEWLNKKEYKKAIEDYSVAIKLDSKPSESYMKRGYAWKDYGYLDKALDDYAKAIETNPNNYRAYIFRAETWHEKEEYDKAIEDCEKAIKINPSYKKAHLFLDVFKQLKKLKKEMKEKEQKEKPNQK